MFKSIITLVSLLFLNQSMAGTMMHDKHHQHSHHHFTTGEPANKKDADYQIEVTLLDSMRFVFKPSLDTINLGDTVTFQVMNTGKVQHEFSIDKDSAHLAHREMMMKNPNMVHTEPNTVSLKPGEHAELTWRFNQSGDITFACNVPGHYEAGMVKALKLQK